MGTASSFAKQRPLICRHPKHDASNVKRLRRTQRDPLNWGENIIGDAAPVGPLRDVTHDERSVKGT